MHLDLVVLGNLIVDDIVYEDGQTQMAQPGGATLYMALTARLWNLEVGLVSIAGSDFPPTMLDALEERGVDLSAVQRSQDPGLRTWLLYEGDVRRVLHRLEGATHEQASPAATDVPTKWQPRAIHLAPMPFDLQHRMASELSMRYGREVLLSLDPFELLVAADLSRWRDLLSQIDLFFVSEDEITSRQIQSEPEPFLRQLLAGRLDTVFYKQGKKGGLTVRPVEEAHPRWDSQAATVTDTTGAGDAFACGVLAGLLHRQPLARALQQGVVSASFAIQGQGAEALLQATPATVRRRLETWFGT